MKVEITRNVMVNGEPVKAGSFVELEQSIAAFLVGSGKAKVITDLEPVVETAPSSTPKAPSRASKPSARRGRTKQPTGED